LQRRHTIAKIVNQAQLATLPTTPVAPTKTDYNAKLARYRAALDAGADPAIVAGWIAEVQAAQHQAAQRLLEPAPTDTTNLNQLS
jgi:site-specific DNA recombinase